MKKVVFAFTTVALATVFIACKNEAKNTQLQEESQTENTTPRLTEEIAMADLSSEEDASVTYMFVTAPSGLSLREYGNLQSEKLAKMPYGTKVKVIQAEDEPTMTVAGIKGGMNQVEFNHKRGFAFNGYLSKYFPPELNISAKGYVAELKEWHPEVSYSEEKGGTASKPINTETISLPDAEWHEAFIIAQRLFDFPGEFEFPNPKGKKSETILDGKPKKGVWTSQLDISRNETGFEEIAYVYGSEKLDIKVRIVKDANTMKISKSETVK